MGSEMCIRDSHQVSSEGVLPLPARVDAIKSFKTPDSKLSLQRFLGMINYYRRFVPGLAATLILLHSAVSSAGKSKSIVWSEECASVFQAAKDDLFLLHHPNPFSSTSLTVDASDYTVGAELSQKSPEGILRPIAFFSRKLTPAERKYSAFDRELLAIFVAVKHFHTISKEELLLSSRITSL